VVRLWDWIGPHDELVPFGRRAPDHEAERPAEEPSPDVFAACDAPPSAEDFWGERAGGLHDALQPPTENREPDGAGDAPVHASGAAARTARPLARLLRRLRPAPASGLHAQRSTRRRVIVAGAAAISVLAATGIALTIGVFGESAAPTAGAAKTQVASVLSDGLNRILSLDLPVTAPRPARAHAAVRRPSLTVGRARSRSHYITEPVHYVPSRATSDAAPPHPSVDAASAQATPPSPPPSATNYTSNRPASSSNASTAPVTPTGESGALGPIQSPNG
jgi:hypothetical protein